MKYYVNILLLIPKRNIFCYDICTYEKNRIINFGKWKRKWNSKFAIVASQQNYKTAI